MATQTRGNYINNKISMSQNWLLLAAFFAFLAIHFHVSCGFNNSDYGVKRIPYNCTQTSSCGGILIKYPFRLEGDPPDCRDPNYELSCENNQTILSLDFQRRRSFSYSEIIIVWDSERFLVKAINYSNSTIRIADVGVRDGDCSSRPINSFEQDYSSNSYPRYYTKEIRIDGDRRCDYRLYKFPQLYYHLFYLFYMSCEGPVVESSTYVDIASPCINQNKSTNNRRYHYAMVANFLPRELHVSCAFDFITLATLDFNHNLSYMDIHKKLVYGMELSWATIACRGDYLCRGDNFCCVENNTIIQSCTGSAAYINDTRPYWYNFYDGIRYKLKPGKIKYFFNEWLPRAIRSVPLVIKQKFLVPVLVTRTLLGLLCLSALVVYQWRKKHLSMDDTLEEFLQSQSNFMPIRYSYSQIRKMSGRFREKLGEGGYGSVFKGKLRSGRLVAIKMLGKAKANGQDFINEVATIGRIHHVNVVSLVGFCSDGTERALIYPFMPKGSLDKYMLSRVGHISLGWKKMDEICLGVARGIEYLHRGCDMQILHFDIKPHNILLDEIFVPKISDFGLAKLYSTNKSIVSLTTARGTIGYIAPELIYKRNGGVSHKADVYSFGMLLMEMLGKKNNPNAAVDNNSSQMYFPVWVYNEMIQGKIAEVEDAIEEEEKNIIKKMTIVALWCIQIRPCDRPSMRKAIQMLEGHAENLELPPEPTFNIEQVPSENVEDPTLNSTWPSSTSVDTSESVRLVIDAE